MKLGFNKGEGWWTVGLHLFTMLICALALASVVAWVYPLDIGKDLLEFAGIAAGTLAGDLLFNALRDRRRRHRTVG
jgi:hypothetical protein